MNGDSGTAIGVARAIQRERDEYEARRAAIRLGWEARAAGLQGSNDPVTEALVNPPSVRAKIEAKYADRWAALRQLTGTQDEPRKETAPSVSPQPAAATSPAGHGVPANAPKGSPTMGALSLADMLDDAADRLDSAAESLVDVTEDGGAPDLSELDVEPNLTAAKAAVTNLKSGTATIAAVDGHLRDASRLLAGADSGDNGHNVTGLISRAEGLESDLSGIKGEMAQLADDLGEILAALRELKDKIDGANSFSEKVKGEAEELMRQADELKGDVQSAAETMRAAA